MKETENTRKKERKKEGSNAADKKKRNTAKKEGEKEKGAQKKKRNNQRRFVCWLVGCLTSQQQASVSHGRICSDTFTCCHTEIEVADPTFYLTQSQYTDTGPTSPSADPITPGAWQGSHWSANFEVTGMTRPRKNPGASGIRTQGPSALEADALTTRPTRRSVNKGKRQQEKEAKNKKRCAGERNRYNQQKIKKYQKVEKKEE